MTAVIQIHEMTAQLAGVDKTDDTVRFKSADETTVDQNNRLQIPGAGTDYSWTKQLRAYVETVPGTDVSNLKFYGDGTNNFGTGVGVNYDILENFATQTDADISGTEFFANCTAGTTGTWNTLCSWDATWTAGEGQSYWGSFLRLQMTVASTASPGALSAETLTFSYDET